jgi:hypothetical protein
LKTLAWNENKGIAVDPFIGKGAPLNRAIAFVLGIEQPQTTRRISKNISSIPFFNGTSLSTVNKRVRDLERRQYLKKAQVNQRVGGITNYYQLTPNLELAAYIDTNTPKELFTDINKDDKTTILAAFKKAQERKKSVQRLL